MLIWIMAVLMQQTAGLYVGGMNMPLRLPDSQESYIRTQIAACAPVGGGSGPASDPAGCAAAFTNVWAMVPDGQEYAIFGACAVYQGDAVVCIPY